MKVHDSPQAQCIQTPTMHAVGVCYAFNLQGPACRVVVLSDVTGSGVGAGIKGDSGLVSS